MKAPKWAWWLLTGLLAVGVAFATLGCDGDEETDGGLDPDGLSGGTTIVTNVVEVSGGETAVIVATNVPADAVADAIADAAEDEAEDEAEADDPDPEPAAEPEIAPQPMAAADGTVIRSVVADIGVPVTFRWGAVPGAIGYRLEVGGAQYDRDNQQITLNFRQSPVPYSWNVRAFRPDTTLGPPSETYSFSIMRQ